MSHASDYLHEVGTLVVTILRDDVERMAIELARVRDRGGRVFFVGVGGSLANAHHAVNDFRKLCAIEAYAPQAAELTARANDEGWRTVFFNPFWQKDDALFVLSVGGGTPDVSLPIVTVVGAAKEAGLTVFGIVGRDGGYTKRQGDCVIVVPTVNPAHVTPHTEAFQSVILHCLVSHPRLQRSKTTW